MSNGYTDNEASALPEGVRLFQEGNFQEALPILEAHAHEDALVCIMAAQTHKKLGDLAQCKRYLFTAADSFGSGDAAMLLAQEYMQEENYVSALTWAERANKHQIPAAGQLILRLSEKTGQWEKCLKLALEDLEWLKGYDRFSLCEEIGALLDGGHYADEVILELIGPVLSSLDDDPVAKERLEDAYRNAETRKANAQEREQKAREQAEFAQQAQQNKQEAKVQAQERAAQAVKQAKKAKKKAVRKSGTKNFFLSAIRFLFVAAMLLAMPIGFNMVAHALLTGGEIGYGYVLGAPFLGYVAVALCVGLTSKLLGRKPHELFLFTWLSPIQLAVLWIPIGLAMAWNMPFFQGDHLMVSAPYAMGIANCYLQEIRVVMQGGDVDL